MKSLDEILLEFKYKFKVSPTNCWLWLAGINNHGYATVWLDGKNVYAHRVLYEAKQGKEIPTNTVAHHICGVKRCVNPDHIELMLQPKHIGMHRRKLNLDQLENIIKLYNDGFSLRWLGNKFGLHWTTIRNEFHKQGIKLRSKCLKKPTV